MSVASELRSRQESLPTEEQIDPESWNSNESLSGNEQLARMLNPGEASRLATNSTDATVAAVKGIFFQQSFGHPIAYARILMQIGYEPIPAAVGKTLFGKEALFYPNIFRYLKYIYKVDGFTGLYRGFGCSLTSRVVCWYATSKVNELSDPSENLIEQDPTKLTLNKTIKKTLREVQCQSVGILLSQPFQVMAIRCMGQFIGRETNYSSWNIFQNAQEIYRQQGIGGFFTGLIPRWILEIATIVISNMVIHILKTQLPAQKDMIPLYEYMGSLFAQTATYPMHVVATVTAINQSGLRAGMLPLAPAYPNWQEAYRHLARTEQLKRGSALFNRVATGPSTGFIPIRSGLRA